MKERTNMTFDPASNVQDVLVFGEYGGVNPSITDSATFTFLNPETMKQLFESEVEGCFLYARHWNPSTKYLADALARLEDSDAAVVTASGMAAISCALLQLCGCEDEIISSRTIYGGTYALMKNFLPRMGVKTHFVNIRDLDEIRSKITASTRVLYCESMSNPLLEVADIPALSELAREHGLKLIVDNTFSPMILSPLRLGADVVIHSLTKFINGTSDCVAGCVCSSQEFVATLMDINAGATMLLGPALDGKRAASIWKNLHDLHIRMRRHSSNALYLAHKFEEMGLRVFYPGLPSHPQHRQLCEMMNPGYGFGGILAVDLESETRANRFMTNMQEAKVGYLAVSLGYFKTLFSLPGRSTSSEIPRDEQERMGLSDGLVRISIGIDNDIERTFERIKHCLAG